MEESNFHVPKKRIGLSGKTQEKKNLIQPKGIVGTRTARETQEEKQKK